MELYELLNAIEEQKKKRDCVKLKNLEKQLEECKTLPRKTVKAALKHNVNGFTRFNHAPANMTHNVRSKNLVKGYININGQLWDWSSSYTPYTDVINRRVTVKPVIQLTGE